MQDLIASTSTEEQTECDNTSVGIQVSPEIECKSIGIQAKPLPGTKKSICIQAAPLTKTVQTHVQPKTHCKGILHSKLLGRYITCNIEVQVNVNVKPEVKDVGVQCQLISMKPHPLTSTPLKSLPEFDRSHSLSTDHDSSDSFSISQENSSLL